MKNLLIIISLVISFSSCSKEQFPTSDAVELYEEFWNHVDENYIYFEEKNVDWNEVHNIYSTSLTPNSTDEELLQAVESSMLELKDSHNFILTPFRDGKRHDYDADYEVHFSPELIADKYIKGNLTQELSFHYGMVDDQTLYIYIPEMENFYALRKLIRNLITDDIKNLILDVRNNTGGNSNPVPELLGDFVIEKTYLGGYIEKNGPAHEDQTDVLPVYAIPSLEYHFDVNAFLLTNRTCFSATSYLAAMCKAIPNFTVVGQTTGGGGGGNAGYELSNGWTIAISVSDYLDTEGDSIELGVDPDIVIENTADDILNERDMMLERVLEMTH